MQGTQATAEPYFLHDRPIAVVDQNDIVLGNVFFQLSKSGFDGLLSGGAPHDDPFQLCDAILLGIGFEDIMPPFQACHDNAVNIRVLLETLKGVNQDRLVVYA